MNGFKMKGMGMGIIGWLTFSATAWGLSLIHISEPTRPY